MTQYEVHSFLENRGQPTHDLEAVPRSTRADLDQTLLQQFLLHVRTRRPRLAALSDEELLRNLRVVEEKGDITLAGWLCFARFPQQFFPELTITFVHYPGTQPDQLGPQGERFLDNRRFDGPLPVALDDALQAVVGSMRQRSLIQGLLRQEIPEYPPEAIREALVNAVGHRDYAKLARGTQVQVQMFQNRLGVQNPGGLFGPVNEENLGEPGIQAARNQFLMQLLEDLGPAENRGSGILTMVRATRQAQMSPPELRDHRTFFRVIFPNDTMLDEGTLRWLNQFADMDLSQNQRLALAYTLHQEEINNPVYRRLTGADSREATLELHDLVVRGLLEQDGSGRWTVYRLSSQAEAAEDAAQTASGKPAPAERQEKICQLLAARGSLAARQIASDLGASLATVKRDLTALATARRVEPTAEGPRNPQTMYRLRKKK
jgi:ATP-dependent DNA helicase RecG